MIAGLIAVAVAVALPTVSLDADGLVIVREGKTLRLPLGGVRGARLVLVPLRSDGSEEALWASVDTADGPRGLLIRLTDPPTVIYSITPSTSVPHISSTSRTVWLLDVDGDGWHDAVEYATTFSDVGGQASGPVVQRFLPATGGAGGVGRRAGGPRAPGSEPRRMRLAQLFPSKRVERRGMIDGHSRPLPPVGAAPKDGLGLVANDPPFVGNELLILTIAAGKLHLVHARALPRPALVRDLELGPIRLGARRCDETFFVRDGAVIVRWSPDGNTMQELRVPWDGAALSAPTAPPVPLSPCAAR